MRKNAKKEVETTNVSEQTRDKEKQEQYIKYVTEVLRKYYKNTTNPIDFFRKM